MVISFTENEKTTILNHLPEGTTIITFKQAVYKYMDYGYEFGYAIGRAMIWLRRMVEVIVDTAKRVGLLISDAIDTIREAIDVSDYAIETRDKFRFVRCIGVPMECKTNYRVYRLPRSRC